MCLVPGRGSVKSTEKLVGIVVIIMGAFSLSMMKGFNTKEVCLEQNKERRRAPGLQVPTAPLSLCPHYVLFQLFHTYRGL